MTIVLTILYSLFVIYLAYSNAKREAYYYDILSLINKKHKNLHTYYFIDRSVILALFLLLISFSFNGLQKLNILLLIIYTFCSWDFFHNGFYFIFRNKLNNKIYKDRFKANESNTSTSILDQKGITKDYKSRLTYFIIGLWFLTLSITLQIFN
jgi:hypothetical protein